MSDKHEVSEAQRYTRYLSERDILVKFYNFSSELLGKSSENYINFLSVLILGAFSVIAACYSSGYQAVTGNPQHYIIPVFVSLVSIIFSRVFMISSIIYRSNRAREAIVKVDEIYNSGSSEFNDAHLIANTTAAKSLNVAAVLIYISLIALFYPIIYFFVTAAFSVTPSACWILLPELIVAFIFVIYEFRLGFYK